MYNYRILYLICVYKQHWLCAFSCQFQWGGKVPEQVVCVCILTPLLRVLHHLHSHGICHRDIKVGSRLWIFSVVSDMQLSWWTWLQPWLRMLHAVSSSGPCSFVCACRQPSVRVNVLLSSMFSLERAQSIVMRGTPKYANPAPCVLRVSFGWVVQYSFGCSQQQKTLPTFL